jgi:hypothetical protein
MRPTRLLPPDGTLDESLDTPAYMRGVPSLSDFQRAQAVQASARDDASNRSFNRQFWATMASEAGGVPSGILTAKVARWVSGIVGGQKPAG